MGKGTIYYRIDGLQWAVGSRQLAVGSWRWAVCKGQFAGDGALAIYENGTQLEVPIYGASRLGMYNKASGTSVYQLTDHLGNVRAVISKNGSEAVAATSTTDYYPFGMPMPNRQIINGQPYRYAYQGQEKDSETGKEAFQLRLWDARIGRWLTTDPKGEFSSPYLGMGNNPMSLVDPDGGSTAPHDEWNYNVKSGKLTWVSNKGGPETQYINIMQGDNVIKTSVISGTDFWIYNLKNGITILDYDAKLPMDYNSVSGYEYDTNDFRARNKQLKTGMCYTCAGPEILRRERAGMASPLSRGNYVKDYEKRYGSSSALFFFADPNEAGIFLPEGGWRGIANKGYKYLKGAGKGLSPVLTRGVKKAIRPRVVSGKSLSSPNYSNYPKTGPHAKFYKQQMKN